MQPHSTEHLQNYMIVKTNSMLKIQKSLKENNDFVMLECYYFPFIFIFVLRIMKNRSHEYIIML